MWSYSVILFVRTAGNGGSSVPDRIVNESALDCMYVVNDTLKTIVTSVVN